MRGSEEERSGEEPGRFRSAFAMKGPTVARIWSFFFLTVFFVLFLILLWKAVPVLLLLFSGVLVAIALRFLSDTVSRWTKIPPLWSLSFVVLIVLGGGIVFGVLAAPSIFSQMNELGMNLRESVANLEAQVRETPLGKRMIAWVESVGEEGGPSFEMWSQVAGVFTTTFGALAGFVLTLVVGLFLAYNPRLYLAGFLRLIPMEKRERTREIVCQIGDTLRWWMVGQLISMLVLAVSTWLMLWLLGVPLAFTLAMLTGVLTFIPYLGPLLALLPMLLIAFVESPTLMLWVLGLYLVIQNLEGNVLMPIIFEKTVQLPPVLTIIAQILLGAIFGFVGILLATPLMAAGIDLVKLVYVEDVLGDSMKEPLRELD